MYLEKVSQQQVNPEVRTSFNTHNNRLALAPSPSTLP